DLTSSAEMAVRVLCPRRAFGYAGRHGGWTRQKCADHERGALDAADRCGRRAVANREPLAWPAGAASSGAAAGAAPVRTPGLGQSGPDRRNGQAVRQAALDLAAAEVAVGGDRRSECPNQECRQGRRGRGVASCKTLLDGVGPDDLPGREWH